MAVFGAGVPTGDGHHGVDAAMQVVGQAFHVPHRAEMGEVDGRRFERHQASDRGMQRLGIELHRRGGGNNERPLVAVQLAIGQAEGVAAEYAPAAGVVDGVVVACMAGRVEAAQDAPGQVHLVAIGSFDHAPGRHWLERAVAAPHLLFAVDRRGSGPQFRRVDHVPCAARMHRQPCVRQGGHQPAGAAGVIQMHMGEDQPIDIGNRQSGLGQGLHQPRLRVVGAAVDEGAASVLDHQIGGVEVRPLEAGVDGVDAVVVVHAGSVPPGATGIIGWMSPGGIPAPAAARRPASWRSGA